MIRKTNCKKNNKGFTMAEVLMSLISFLLLMGMIGAAVKLGIDSFRRTENEILAQETYQRAVESIMTDFKQAIINPAPTGYQTISPSVQPTAILLPNFNKQKSNVIQINIPNPDNYNPLESVFDQYDPAMYKLIEYYIQDKKLYRRVTTYTKDGKSAKSSPQLIAETEKGSISMTADYISDKTSRITIVVIEDLNGKFERTCGENKPILLTTIF
jgi:type II secretory pathway pseudopilin PulG